MPVPLSAPAVNVSDSDFAPRKISVAVKSLASSLRPVRRRNMESPAVTASEIKASEGEALKVSVWDVRFRGGGGNQTGHRSPSTAARDGIFFSFSRCRLLSVRVAPGWWTELHHARTRRRPWKCFALSPRPDERIDIVNGILALCAQA